MRSLIAGALTGLIVAVTVCRFIQADAGRHLDEHLRRIEERWPRPERCWP
jgi:hypothetical protein